MDPRAARFPGKAKEPPPQTRKKTKHARIGKPAPSHGRMHHVTYLKNSMFAAARGPDRTERSEVSGEEEVRVCVTLFSCALGWVWRDGDGEDSEQRHKPDYF